MNVLHLPQGIARERRAGSALARPLTPRILPAELEDSVPNNPAADAVSRPLLKMLCKDAYQESPSRPARVSRFPLRRSACPEVRRLVHTQATSRWRTASRDQAAKRRQSAAHGASRGWQASGGKHNPEGAKGGANRIVSLEEASQTRD